MTVEITVDGTKYICTKPPYRYVLNLIRWMGVFADKEESLEMRNMAIIQYAEMEDLILDECVDAASKDVLVANPLHAARLVNQLVFDKPSKKKSEASSPA